MIRNGGVWSAGVFSFALLLAAAVSEANEWAVTVSAAQDRTLSYAAAADFAGRMGKSLPTMSEACSDPGAFSPPHLMTMDFVELPLGAICSTKTLFSKEETLFRVLVSGCPFQFSGWKRVW